MDNAPIDNGPSRTVGARGIHSREALTTRTAAPPAARTSYTPGLSGALVASTAAFANRTRMAGGVVLQDDLSVFERRLRVLPALRFDGTEGVGNAWLPRIGVIGSLLPWLRLKANLERSYRAPNFDELYLPDRCFVRGNPNLQPEDATNWDAGIELGFDAVGPVRDLHLSAAYFRNRIQESIVFVLVSPFTVAAENTGAAHVEGVEGDFGFGLFGWARLSASGTWLEARLDRTHTPLPGRATAEATLRLVVGPPSGLVKLVGEARYTGEIPVTDTGRTVLPERTVYDASVIVDLAKLEWLAGYVPAEAMRVALIGRNLTDRAVRDAQFFPQPGRTLSVRVETVW